MKKLLNQKCTNTILPSYMYFSRLSNSYWFGFSVKSWNSATRIVRRRSYSCYCEWDGRGLCRHYEIHRCYHCYSFLVSAQVWVRRIYLWRVGDYWGHFFAFHHFYDKLVRNECFNNFDVDIESWVNSWSWAELSSVGHLGLRLAMSLNRILLIPFISVVL